MPLSTLAQKIRRSQDELLLVGIGGAPRPCLSLHSPRSLSFPGRRQNARVITVTRDMPAKRVFLGAKCPNGNFTVFSVLPCNTRPTGRRAGLRVGGLGKPRAGRGRNRRALLVELPQLGLERVGPRVAGHGELRCISPYLCSRGATLMASASSSSALMPGSMATTPWISP